VYLVLKNCEHYELNHDALSCNLSEGQVTKIVFWWVCDDVTQVCDDNLDPWF
jgi:hypothetical protein